MVSVLCTLVSRHVDVHVHVYVCTVHGACCSMCMYEHVHTALCDTIWVTRLYSSLHSLRVKPLDNQRHPPDQPAAAELDGAAVP